MKSLLLFITSLAFAQIGIAQLQFYDNPTTLPGNSNYHEFEPNSDAYLLADNVNIRSQANTKSDIVANLAIGTKLKINSSSKKELQINGFKTNWYEVSFKDKGETKRGFVWGGFIAEGYLTSLKNKETLFFYGISSVVKTKEEYGYDNITIQIRACKNSQELSKLEFKAGGGLYISHSISNFDNQGLNSIDDIIAFSVSEQKCAGFNEDVVVFWDGKKLHYVTALNSGGDAPYYASENLIFPKHKGGLNDRIILETQEGESVENDGDGYTDLIYEHKKIEFKWTGSKLKKVKVLLDKKKS